MAININPNRINVANTARKSADRRRESELDAPVVVPSRADVNYIPSPETLRSLISNAVAALRKGVHWDRGTILNLLV